MSNYFEELNQVNVSDRVENKNGLSYLPWADAWTEVKKKHPDATYTIYKNRDDWDYFTDGRTCWVEVGVTINGIEHIEHLPIMNFRNQSIKLDDVTSMDVCKAHQRAATKACARHGLGLYVYRGEDLPEASLEPTGEPVEKTLSLSEQILACKTEDELGELYKANKKKIVDNNNLLSLVTEQGKKLKGAA